MANDRSTKVKNLTLSDCSLVRIPRLFKTRSLTGIAAVLLSASMLASCGSSADGSSSDDTAENLEDIFGQNLLAQLRSTASPEQQALLDDDVVTTEEYRRAFDAFRQCVREAGTDLMDVRADPQTGEMHFGSRTIDSGRVESCYEQHYMFVDIVFQGSPAVRAQRDAQFLEIWSSEVHPCLEANGIVGSPPTLQDAEMAIGSPEAGWFDQYMRLLQTNAC